jgi:hypothetical protein
LGTIIGRERREEDGSEREDRKEEMAWVLAGRERREEDESEREDRKEEMAWVLVERGEEGGR